MRNRGRVREGVVKKEKGVREGGQERVREREGRESEGEREG